MTPAFFLCVSDGFAQAGKDLAQTVVAFLKWYKKEFRSVNSHGILKGGGKTPCAVNFSGTKAYLAHLKRSGYISQACVARWEKRFIDADKEFRQKPQYEGSHMDFDYDLVLHTQVVEETLGAIDNCKILSVEKKQGRSVVVVDINVRLRFKPSQYGGKWLIDEIGTARDDDR